VQAYCLTVPQRSARRAIVTSFKAWFVEECLKSIHSPALA
jgi:LysR family glycine cleavage system transcriptional activator